MSRVYRTRSLVLVPFFAAACGAPAGGGGAPVGPGNDGAGAVAATDFVVWQAGALDDDGNQAIISTWYAADGSVRGDAVGPYVADAGELWRIDAHRQELAGVACDPAMADADMGGSAAWLTAENLAGASHRLTAPIDAPTEAGSVAQWQTLQGSLGATLFVLDAVDGFFCGAHGSVHVTPIAVDVATGTAVEPPTLAPTATADVIARGATALRADAEEGEDYPEAELQVGAVVPAVVDGAVGASVLVFGDACYACSRGGWDSYTAATWVAAPATAVAWDLDLPPLPAAVAARLAALPPGTPYGVSWGRAAPAWSTTFRP